MIDRSPRVAAEDFRREHALGVAPLDDLVEVIERVPNVHVAIEPATNEQQHGMRATDPERRVTILAATATSHPVRLRSTLAHELAHHLYGDPTPTHWSARTPEEVRADSFARHLLIPVDGLRQMLGSLSLAAPMDERVFSQVVKWFRVSPALAAIQMFEAGYLTNIAKGEFSSLSTRSLATRHGWLPTYQQWSSESQQIRPPRRIAEAAINAYAHQATPLATVANIHGLSGQDMQQELENAGVAPRSPDLDAPDDSADQWGDDPFGDTP